MNRSGRYYARLVVPKDLRAIIGKTELSAPLGGDYREALRSLHSAVARLDSQIENARRIANAQMPLSKPNDKLDAGTFARAVWETYQRMLDRDERERERFPSDDQIDAALEKAIERIQGEKIDIDNPLALLDVSLEAMAVKSAASIATGARQAKLKDIRKHLAKGETALIAHEVDDYLDRHGLNVERGTPDWISLARRMMRAEAEALERALERDQGIYTGAPTDPIVKPPAPDERRAPVSLKQLWEDYVSSRVQAGFMRDGGRRQGAAIKSLKNYLKHDDANRITKKDVQDWRDELMKTLTAKTVSDVYLSTVRSLFTWACEEDRLSDNPVATVRQAKARKSSSREKGFTGDEALAVLKLSLSYEPKADEFGRIREKNHLVAAKRWAPIICAFTGARISEITQLRKEDVRQEGDRWIIRITPDAGTVKAGDYRDVPLHRQIVELGFIDFVKAAKPGPLFHGGSDPNTYTVKASRISSQLAEWLRKSGAIPDALEQPNHAWRHRFKTKARELEIDSRVIDAIQGHAGRTAGDDYGDVTMAAKTRAIEQFPSFALNC